MTNARQTWQLERHAPVRADAEGLFVPCSELPNATVGDTVVVHGEEQGVSRTGTIAARRDGDDEQFFRLDLDS